MRIRHKDKKIIICGLIIIIRNTSITSVYGTNLTRIIKNSVIIANTTNTSRETPTSSSQWHLILIGTVIRKGIYKRTRCDTRTSRISMTSKLTAFDNHLIKVERGESVQISHTCKHSISNILTNLIASVTRDTTKGSKFTLRIMIANSVIFVSDTH